MNWQSKQILDILDAACKSFRFPMLDNGYVYLAATRLSLFRSITDWAMVIEEFGFSPRAGLPSTSIQTFASTLHNRDPETNYITREAYRNYLANNPHNEGRYIAPIATGSWQDEEDLELINSNGELILRNQSTDLPPTSDYQQHGITLEDDEPEVFELCRYLAALYREDVLCTDLERRVSVLPDMEQILQLEEWHHPDVADEELPSELDSFQQIANVLVSGDTSMYSPTQPPNTHWSHWPEGGTL